MQDPRAGGRASSRPTSPWTPRTCCCASSSASARRADRGGRGALDPLVASATTATWANFYGGPPDLSTTVEAYVALRLAGDPVEAEHMRPGRSSTSRRCRRDRAPAGCSPGSGWRCSGSGRGTSLPVLPPEIMLFAALCPAQHLRLRVLGPPDRGGTHRRQRPPAGPRDCPSTSTSSSHVGPLRGPPLARHLGRALPAPRPGPPALRAPPGRAAAPLRRCGRAERWIVQAPGGRRLLGWHPAALGVLADRPAPAGLRPRPPGACGPACRASTASPSKTSRGGASRRASPRCGTPRSAVTALADAGVAPDDPSLRRAARWLVAEEITVPGDWSVRRPDLAPGGWAFEFANDNYPDIDDTAEVVLALCAAPTRTASDGRRTRRSAWTEGMQCRDGGWGAFDVDNTQALCRELPFCDFGELTDPPSADVTAHVVEMLANLGPSGRGRPSGGSAGCSMPRRPTVPGSAAGGQLVYGTGAVVPALWSPPACRPDHPAFAAPWPGSKSTRTTTAAGARTCAPTGTRLAGRGASTASQTAWALLALLAAGERGPRATTGGSPGSSTTSA